MKTPTNGSRCEKKEKSDPARFAPLAGSEKKNETFEKILARIVATNRQLARDNAIKVIAEVRRVKCGLNGVKLSQILDATESVISSKRKNQCVFAHGQEDYKLVLAMPIYGKERSPGAIGLLMFFWVD